MPTPLRAVRIPTQLWEAALSKTRQEGTTVTAVILQALTDYVNAGLAD